MAANDPPFSAKRAPVVIFVIFPDVKLLDVTGPVQVFSDVRRVGGFSYEVKLASAEGGVVLTDTCVPLQTEKISALGGQPIHTLLVAGGYGVHAAAKNPALIEGVQDLAASAERVGSVCTGAFVLAAAGLLSRHRAVTHWWECENLARQYPDLTVEPDRIYLKSGGVWTSAGVTAGIDMSLAMVAEDSGRKIALRLARNLVTFMARPGGQSQFSSILSSQISDAEGKFDDLHTWIANHLDQDLKVERLAEKAGMSPRNFARVYQSATGRTPAKGVELIRLMAARDQLEDSGDPIGLIARRTGFTNGERLRRVMHRVLGLSPHQFRARFGQLPD